MHSVLTYAKQLYMNTQPTGIHEVFGLTPGKSHKMLVTPRPKIKMKIWIPITIYTWMVLDHDTTTMFFVLTTDKKISLSLAIPPISSNSPPLPCIQLATSAHLISTGLWHIGQSKSLSLTMSQFTFILIILKSIAMIVHLVNTKQQIHYLYHPISAQCYT